jgi:hypothetical protein
MVRTDVVLEEMETWFADRELLLYCDEQNEENLPLLHHLDQGAKARCSSIYQLTYDISISRTRPTKTS